MAPAAVAGGLVGGLLAAAAMAGLERAGDDGSPPPSARFWARFVGDGDPEACEHEALALHLVYGVLAGGAFTLLAPGVGSVLAGLLWGVGFGVALFGVAAAFWLVLVLGFSPDGPMAARLLLLHLAYGAILGTWTGLGLLAGG